MKGLKIMLLICNGINICRNFNCEHRHTHDFEHLHKNKTEANLYIRRCYKNLCEIDIFMDSRYFQFMCVPYREGIIETFPSINPKLTPDENVEIISKTIPFWDEETGDWVGPGLNNLIGEDYVRELDRIRAPIRRVPNIRFAAEGINPFIELEGNEEGLVFYDDIVDIPF